MRRLIMAASAVAMALLGLVATFAPDEILAGRAGGLAGWSAAGPAAASGSSLAGEAAGGPAAEAGGAPAARVLPLLVQLLGALYLGFAMLNWMAKDSLIGGIYNRPVALGNFLHFVAGAFALGKGIARGAATAEVMALAAIYAVFAVLFGWILFTSPVERT